MKTEIILIIDSCIDCSLYSDGGGFTEPFCRHHHRYKDGEWVSTRSVPETCPARLNNTVEDKS